MLTWQLPKSYISRFVKKEPGDPFQQLLTDEGQVTEYFHTLKTKKEKVIDSKKRLNQAQAIIKKYLKELKEEDSENSNILVERCNEILSIINESKRLLSRAEEVQSSSESSILYSSWLSSGVVSFNALGSITNREFEETLSILALKTASMLNNLNEYPIINALLLSRDVLVLMSNIPSYGTNDNSIIGSLSLIVIKKSNPKRIYGPYKYPNVPFLAWEDMQKARGSYGSGAGKVFWDKYLRPIYGKQRGVRHATK